MLTKKKRTILFWLSIVAFFALLGPMLIYSAGYRLGPNWTLVKTGGIFIKASKNGALVSVDGTRKYTSFISKSVLIKNVSPGFHKTSVSLGGYFDWEKNLEVTPELVTSREALLVPQDVQGKMLGTTSPQLTEPYLKKEVLFSYNDAGKPGPIYSSVKKFWKQDGDFLILGEDNNFYKNGEPYEIPENWGEKAKAIFTGKKMSLITADATRIIYWDESGIDSYWISDIGKMPQWENLSAKPDGVDRYLHIYSTDKGLRAVAEYPDYQDYLLAEISNGIFVLEIESTGGQNIFPLYKGKYPEIVSVPNSPGGELIIKDGANYIGLELP
ncbi:MAG: hypothetical protein Q7S12_04790 [bacterium]|nr:hypothetical protein [bacterium]